jgi:hypothetical protein
MDVTVVGLEPTSLANRTLPDAPERVRCIQTAAQNTIWTETRAQ